MRFKIIAFVLCSFKLSAFTLQNSAFTHFPVDEVVINISDNSCSNINETPASIKSKVEIAINKYWNTVTTSRLKLKIGTIKSGLGIGATTTVDQAMELAEENSIIISCSPNTTLFNSDYINAFANIRASNSNKGAVLLNNVNTPILAQKGDDEKIAVLAHEIGHALGIGHSEITHALMYYTADQKNQASLSKDDIDALTYLYPNRPPLACGSVVDISRNNKNQLLNFFAQMLLGFGIALAFLKFNSRKNVLKV